MVTGDCYYGRQQTVHPELHVEVLKPMIDKILAKSKLMTSDRMLGSLVIRFCGRSVGEFVLESMSSVFRSFGEVLTRRRGSLYTHPMLNSLLKMSSNVFTAAVDFFI
jgi:hypothetical protein